AQQLGSLSPERKYHRNFQQTILRPRNGIHANYHRSGWHWQTSEPPRMLGSPKPNRLTLVFSFFSFSNTGRHIRFFGQSIARSARDVPLRSLKSVLLWGTPFLPDNTRLISRGPIYRSNRCWFRTLRIP